MGNIRHRRNNCYVRYRLPVMIGWISVRTFEPLSRGSVEIIMEPFVYFIQQAKKTLDINFLFLEVQHFNTALKDAHERGVIIRVLHDQENLSQDLEWLMSINNNVGGVLCIPDQLEVYVNQVHRFKYMIRDFESDKACVCVTVPKEFDPTTIWDQGGEADTAVSEYKPTIERSQHLFNQVWDTVLQVVHET